MTIPFFRNGGNLMKRARSSSILFGCLLATLGCGWYVAMAEEPATSETSTPKFKAPGNLLNTTKTSATLSPDHKVASHIFEGLGVEVSTMEAGKPKNPEGDQSVATVWIPVEASESPVVIKQQLRGHVDVPAGIEATLLIQCAGETQVMNLADCKGKDFLHEWTCTVQPGSDYVATFFLSAQRAARKGEVGGCLVQIDSLDLTFEPANKAK